MSPPSVPRRELRRVLMTSDTIGGVWTYSIDLCRGLQNYGVQVVLLSMGRLPDADQVREVATLPNVTLIPTDHRLEWMSGCEEDLHRSGDILLGLEDEFQPDIIHLNTYWHASLPLRAPRLVAAHSCVASWWAACRGTDLPDEWSPYLSWVRKATQAADIVIAPSAAHLRELQRLYGRVPRWQLIRNGRDPSLFRTGPKRDLALAAGRLWDEAKNIGALCEAANEIDLPAIMVAGDAIGPNGEMAPSGKVSLLGKLTHAELARCMASASIFVAPARYEPFGLTVLEAALSACALVLGDIPTMRELWDDAALFVDPGNPAELRSALRHLQNNPARRAELGAKACARAARYPLADMARSYHQAYCNLLSSDLEAVA
jgi:glycogen synthase